MKIHGLQKMTLLDYPGKVACTVFLGGCDFRCPFCHNWDIVDNCSAPTIEDLELIEFLKTRQGLLDGVAITGGEPLLREELPELLIKIRELGYKIKIDTNGNHPEMLKRLVSECLVDYVAMDIKNSKEKYGETIGKPEFNISNVDESVKFLLEGHVEYEFRTTVVKQLHDETSFIGISEWINGAQKYFLQAFVDRDTVPCQGFGSYDKNDMNTFAQIMKKTVKNVEIRGI